MSSRYSPQESKPIPLHQSSALSHVIKPPGQCLMLLQMDLVILWQLIFRQVTQRWMSTLANEVANSMIYVQRKTPAKRINEDEKQQRITTSAAVMKWGIVYGPACVVRSLIETTSHFSSSSCSSLVMPNRYRRSCMLLVFRRAGAINCTFGFAWKATPRPATPIIGRSLAPSPTHTT